MMANDIGAYFAGYRDQDEAVEGVANHLRNFWEARMRREIVDYVAKGGDELSPLVREAVALIATESVVETEETGRGMKTDSAHIRTDDMSGCRSRRSSRASCVEMACGLEF